MTALSAHAKFDGVSSYGPLFVLPKQEQAESPKPVDRRSEPGSRLRPSPLPTIELLGICVANASKTETLDWIFARLASGRRTCVHYLNAHSSNVAAFDCEYRRALSNADLVVPDGSGVAIFARLHGKRLVCNLNLTDLIPLVYPEAGRYKRLGISTRRRYRGSRGCGEELVNSCPGLRIAGTHYGFFSEDQEKQVIHGAAHP